MEFKKQKKQAKGKKLKRERQTKKQTLNYREQSDGYQRGGQWGRRNWVMGMKEGTCPHEQWVIYGSVESLYCTPKTNITLES